MTSKKEKNQTHAIKTSGKKQYKSPEFNTFGFIAELTGTKSSTGSSQSGSK